MAGQEAVTGLAGWVRQLLGHPISLTPDQHTFMHATFGTTDLAAIMSDAAQCEVDSLLELLFFPDVAQCIRYEAQWGHLCFTPRDQAAILGELTAQSIRASIKCVPDQGPVSIEIPAFVMAAFVQRLNIGWQAPIALRSHLDQLTDRTSAHGLMAALRRVSLDWHAGQVELMKLYLEKRQPPSADDDAFALLLSLLPELSPGMAFYDFLIDKKAFYFQALCKTEEFDRRRQTESMEVLMLQGVRAGCGSAQQWRNAMSLIDRLSLTMFGRTQFFHHPLDQYQDVDGLS